MATQSVPSPLGGWNARDPLDAMQPTDAIAITNWFPQANAVFGRGGSITRLTNVTGTSVSLHTLVTYNGLTQSQLVAAGRGKIWTIDPDAATATQIGTGFSSSQVIGWQTGHFNGKMVFTNGTDSPQVWDGTTLSAFVGSLGVPVATAAITSTGAGTVAAGLHGYRVTATYAGSTETTPSVETTVTNVGATNTNTITWPQVPNATGYKVYGRTSAAELLMFTISSGSTLSFVDNGSVTPAGAMPVTDTTPLNLIGVMNLKGRALYWIASTLGFYYADAGAFQGALHYFPLDFVFLKGGYLMFATSWSRDNGDGVDDMIAFISSNGELIVYQGTDPSSATTWAMVGRFNVGSPLNIRSHGKVASQEILLTTEGFSSTDEAIASQTTDQVQGFGGKIVRAASAAVAQYGANVGWECLYYPRQQMFIINVPIAGSSTTPPTQCEQYVRNTDTGAWARFTGWNATAFTVFKNRLYFATATGNIVLADTDSNDASAIYPYGDDGASVTRDCTQAYVRFNNPGMKCKVTAVQIVSNMIFPTKASVNIFSDYAFRSLPAVTQADFFATSYWDTNLWDTFYWGDPTIDPTQANASPRTFPVRGYGFANALSFRYNMKSQQIIWYSSNYVYENAGV